MHSYVRLNDFFWGQSRVSHLITMIIIPVRVDVEKHLGCRIIIGRILHIDDPGAAKGSYRVLDLLFGKIFFRSFFL